MPKLNANLKAELLATGSVDVDASLLTGASTSAAGPGTGQKSIFFTSGGHRVRLEINKNSPLAMIKGNNDFIILKDAKELVKGEIEPVLAHCPEQAYITLSERCIYDCKFCSVPKLQGRIKTLDEVVNIVEQAKKTGLMKAIAITSGVAESPEDEIERLVAVIRALKRYNVPIGVAAYPTRNSTKLLKEAGADELKYNVET